MNASRIEIAGTVSPITGKPLTVSAKTAAVLGIQQEPTGMTVELKHAANPDIAGGYWEARPPKGARLVTVGSLKEASDVCQSFIREWGLGGGNWTGGAVRRNGKTVARISYNGRAWEPGNFPTKEIALS
jgi:hypothetical protein